MANPTTNFGWVMPTSSSLVTNLPADFNTFGQAVDTSMSELLGGTTGQVLSKTSATNMDFTWVTPTDQTPLTTKGDLFTFTTVDARLAVGANGETLVADSSASTGLRYTAGTVQSNPVLNSAFQVWQRGTTGTTTSGITYPSADRWNAWTFAAGGSVTLSRQATGDTTNLPFVQYCGRFQRVAGNTNTGLLMLGQAIETINSIPYAGKTVTYSFYARKGANYSEASSQLNAQLYSNTTTDVSLNTLQATATTVASSAVTLTTTWQRFTVTGTVGATATQLATVFFYAPVGTAGANDYFEVTGVQLDVGSVALPFRTYAATIQGELAACQRYYYLHESSGTSNTSVAAGGYYSSSNYIVPISFPVTMRTAPTFASSTVTNGWSILTNGGLDSINVLVQESSNTRVAQCYNNAQAAGTAGHYGQLTSQSASTSLAWSAEL